MKKLVSILLAASFVIGLITLSGCSSKKVIDMKENTTITLDGYDGSGYLAVKIDHDAIAAMFTDKNSISVLATVSSIKVAKIENNYHLSNGDKVKIKIEYNANALKNADISLKNTEFEYEVSGLEPRKKLDLFKDVKLYVYPTESDNTKCTIDMRYLGEDEALRRIFAYAFEVIDDKGNKLNYDLFSNERNTVFNIGDKVTVSVRDDFIEKEESIFVVYELIETSKEYILEVEE